MVRACGCARAIPYKRRNRCPCLRTDVSFRQLFFVRLRRTVSRYANAFPRVYVVLFRLFIRRQRNNGRTLRKRVADVIVFFRICPGVRFLVSCYARASRLCTNFARVADSKVLSRRSVSEKKIPLEPSSYAFLYIYIHVRPKTFSTRVKKKINSTRLTRNERNVYPSSSHPAENVNVYLD